MPKRKPPRQAIRRMIGPVELPMTDAQLLADAERQVRLWKPLADHGRQERKARHKSTAPSSTRKS